MTARIIMKRNVTADKVKDLIQLLKKMRNACMNQPGYIGGETLKDYNDPGKFLVISTWETIEHWNQWASSSQRLEIQSQIDYLLGEETEYGIYVYAL